MSEDGTGWPDASDVPDAAGEQHDDPGMEAWHEEPGFGPAGPEEAGLYEPSWAEDHGHDVSGEAAGGASHAEYHAGEAPAPDSQHSAEAVHQADEAVRSGAAGDLFDSYSPHAGAPEEPAVFEPGATLFGWGTEPPAGEDVPVLVIEPGYLEAHYATGWALDPQGDGGILAAQAMVGGEHDQATDPVVDPAHDPAYAPAEPGLDHGLHADVLYGGGGLAAWAGEAWHEARPGEPWPAHADGSPLSPHELLRRLSEEATDPVAADVLGRESG
jgi:hypothetical protein